MKESIPGGNKNEQTKTEWDKLGEAENNKAAEVAEITSRDVNYFKEHPEDIGLVVQELINLRGGDESIQKDAKWDKNLHAYVGSDGMPRDWMHLTGYLKKNPDKIASVLEEYQSLLPTASEYADKTLINEERPKNEPRNEDMHQFTQDAVIEKAKAQQEAKEKAEMVERAKAEIAANEDAEKERVLSELEGRDVGKKSYKSEAAKGLAHLLDLAGEKDARPDNIFSIGNEMLDGCSHIVQQAVDYNRSEKIVRRSESIVADCQDRLKQLPRFTFPWSKRHKEKKSLKTIMKTEQRHLEFSKDRLAQLRDFYPTNISDEDQEIIDLFSQLDDTVDRLSYQQRENNSSEQRKAS